MENNSQQPNEMQVIKARQEAEFSLTPIGQQLKQFEMQQRMAQMYSTSTIVPDTYKGNLGNCVIALDMAHRMGANPLMVMQNLYIVHGTPSFSSKFLIASVNASGRYTSLRYEWKGTPGKPDWGCRCYAYEKDDVKKENRLDGIWVDMKMADAEGWTKKNGSKWQSIPQQMLIYRAAAFWQRAYCPEISMGFISSEEAQEIEDVDYEEIPNTVEKRNEAIEAKGNSKVINPDSVSYEGVDPNTGEVKSETTATKAEAAAPPVTEEGPGY